MNPRNASSFSHASAAIALILLGAHVASPSTSQAQEVIVTKQNLRTEGSESAPVPVRPAIVVHRRADYVVQAFLLIDDTRSAEARLGELKTALASLDEAAKRSKDVRIALVAETAEGLQLVRPFDRDRAVAAIENGARPDTSQVRLLVKTAITDADAALSQPVERIEAFVRGVKLAGRAQLEPRDEPVLSLVKPEQYRGAVVSAIAADLHAVAEQFGAGYGGKLEGLEHPLAWEQLDELELGLYIPYRLAVTR